MVSLLFSRRETLFVVGRWSWDKSCLLLSTWRNKFTWWTLGYRRRWWCHKQHMNTTHSRNKLGAQTQSGLWQRQTERSQCVYGVARANTERSRHGSQVMAETGALRPATFTDLPIPHVPLAVQPSQLPTSTHARSPTLSNMPYMRLMKKLRECVYYCSEMKVKPHQ